MVHPVGDDIDSFLPCTYGWATTIRWAQGATLTHGCIFFDHAYPPERGYGYVAISRFKTQASVFHYGRLRRTDWLPIGDGTAAEQIRRSADSDTSDDELADALDAMYEVDFVTDSDALDRDLTPEAGVVTEMSEIHDNDQCDLEHCVSEESNDDDGIVTPVSWDHVELEAAATPASAKRARLMLAEA